jgi:drug/metabolite transporter (DMT)-like permease
VHGVLLVNTLMGLVVLLVLWVPIPILSYTGIETLDIWTDSSNNMKEVILFLCANAGFAVSYYLLYTFGMTATSPLYMSLTGMIGIPTAALADWILKDKTFGPLTLTGMGLVSLGVLAINVHVFFKPQLQRLASFLRDTLLTAYLFIHVEQEK